MDRDEKAVGMCTIEEILTEVLTRSPRREALFIVLYTDKNEDINFAFVGEPTEGLMEAMTACRKKIRKEMNNG